MRRKRVCPHTLIVELGFKMDGVVVGHLCAAPGEVMVPWNEPEVKPVTRFTKRSTVKLPWAPAKRPVPPVMVLISVMLATPGVAVSSLDPAIVVLMLSPLAAIKRAAPVAVPFAR